MNCWVLLFDDSTEYTAKGYYYDGIVVTDDGNEWGYTTDTVPNGTYVTVEFNDNGTPNNIYDDVIRGIY